MTGSTRPGPTNATTSAATPGLDGDLLKALRAIKAKTLILTGTKDLLNPEWESAGRRRYISCRAAHAPSVRAPSPAMPPPAALFPADVEFLNREIGAFLDAAG